MRIYLCGPVMGWENRNTEFCFCRACVEVTEEAFVSGCLQETEIVNPYEICSFISDSLPAMSDEDYRVISHALLGLCDTIYMLCGWADSAQCREEYKYAMEHGYETRFQQDKG